MKYLAMLLLLCSVSYAGDRYIKIELSKDADQQTKEAFKKWVLSLPKENWHGIQDWDVKDTNRVWFVNLDASKPLARFEKPLTVTATTAKDQICDKLTTAERAKVTTEAHNATAEAVPK